MSMSSVRLDVQDIVDTAVEAGFSTLVNAVKAAGLVDALKVCVLPYRVLKTQDTV